MPNDTMSTMTLPIKTGNQTQNKTFNLAGASEAASLGQGYAVDTRQSAAQAVTASITGFQLKAGGIVIVKFAYDVPASATLNIANSGAKPIYYKAAALTASVIKAGDTVTFIYDGTNYHLISMDLAYTTISYADWKLLTAEQKAAKDYFIYDYPTLPDKIGDLDDLNTTEKDSAVDAINEVNTKVSKTEVLISIVENGNTCTHTGGISKGQYVNWKGDLYTADSNISVGATFASSGGSKNLTAVVDGGLNQLNDSYTLLWENPSITSAFVAQDVNVDMSHYKAVMIEFLEYVGGVSSRFTIEARTAIVGTSYIYTVVCPYASDVLKGFSCRKFSVANNSKVHFYEAVGVNEVLNTLCVPYRIWGIKHV